MHMNEHLDERLRSISRLGRRIGNEFFRRDPVSVARDLPGHYLMRIYEDTTFLGYIK